MPQNRSSQGSSRALDAAASYVGRRAFAAASRLNRRKKTPQEPPEVMTWGEAIPVIIVAAIFDLARIFFEWFWFFGPALAAAACTAGVNGVVGTTVAGAFGKVVAAGCTGAAVVGGAFGSEATIAFGTVMAMTVGLAGWMTVGLWLIMTNARIFKENVDHTVHILWFAFSFLISEIPIIGTIPVVSIVIYKMFKFQIKTERAAMKKYKEEQAAIQREEHQKQESWYAQYQSFQMAQDDQEENVAHDAQLAQKQTEAGQSAVEQEEMEKETPNNVIPFPSDRVRRSLSAETNVPQEYREAA